MVIMENDINPKPLPNPETVIRTFLITSGLFTLATAFIWGVNTLFLLDAGLDIFEVMVVNSIYSIGQVFFEIPTGVVADTVGRRVSFLFGIATLTISTLLYLASATFGWGIIGFAVGSILLGLGYTFQTGAVEAWLVDALTASGYQGRTDQVFARGGIVFGISMLIGTIAGGVLGQVDLALPYLTRAAILAIAFIATLNLMQDIGFKARPLKTSRFFSEAKSIFKAGVHYGWQNPAVRPLLLASAAQGSFFMYFFYASQPYALSLLGRPDLIWVSGVLAALFGLASIIGNLFVGLLSRSRWGQSAPQVLTVGAVIFSILVGLAGLVGILAPQEGSITGFVSLVILLFMLGIWMGLTSPIRQGYINAHIPAQQRATVLSLDSFFNDAGSSIGQPSFGWLSRAISIPAAYMLGSLITLIAAPFYKHSGKMADVCIDVGTAEEFCPADSREPIDSISI